MVRTAAKTGIHRDIKMSKGPAFRTDFMPAHGRPVEVAPDVFRVTVNNPGPFTFHGTNSYLVGRKRLAIIDPGPDDAMHLDALKDAIGGRPVDRILVTHTHVDHSPLARKLAELTGASIVGEGPHRPARQLHIGETNPLDASGDREFAPTQRVGDGDRIEGEEWQFEAVFTPGHTANHMCYALADTGILFSGDHVMAWSTSIVAPPDGAMSDYMASLETLLRRRDRLYLPGHGGELEQPRDFVRALRTHRRMREAAIVNRIEAGDRTIPEIVRSIYRDIDVRLHGAASLSVLAHLEDLVAKGRIRSDGPASIGGRFDPAG